jgi:hypothetical protein
VDSRHRGDPGTVSEHVDALFVVHQDVAVSVIDAACHAAGYRSVLVLTTHALFPSERAALERGCERVHCLTFADVLDDAALVACDERATLELEPRSREPAYDAAFRTASLAFKNEAAHRELAKRFSIGAIRFSDGLGVSGSYWASRGGTSLDEAKPANTLERARQLAAAAREELRQLPDVTIVDERFVFFGSIRRLRLRPETTVRSLALHAPVALLRRPALAAALVQRRLSKHAAADWQPCTTIHEYRPAISALAEALGRELLIFVDGHHPSNYPRAYLDMYLSGTFVAAAQPSARWFEQFGRRVLHPFPFQQSEQFTRCEPSPVRTVLLVMNHAGDWTALINRSDTDVLIAAFADLARARQDLTFVLRLHPTMASAAHEGTRSIDRVRGWIDSLGLANLTVSRASLDEDLARAELYLSEYSQVLIDAWRNGRLGVAVNLTGRRSFMADYERFGFPSASSAEELRTLPERSGELAAQQNRAISELERVQRAWEAR